MSEELTTGSTAGRKSVSKELLQDRRAYAVGLKLAGLGISSINKLINSEHKVKGWGEVNRRTVEQDIAQYYRENRALSLQDYDHLVQMREAHLEQMERTIEELSVMIADKSKDWKAFEKADALEKKYKMQALYAEMQNWNYGDINQFNISLGGAANNEMFDMASKDLMVRTKPAAIQAFGDMLRKAIDAAEKEEKEERDRSEIIEGEVE